MSRNLSKLAYTRCRRLVGLDDLGSISSYEYR